jgi:glycosyltransferase XagB
MLALYLIIGAVFMLLSSIIAVNIWLNLYSWSRPEALDDNGVPSSYAPVHNSFTVLLPALNEDKVIAHTIDSLTKLKYDNNMYEIIVLLRTHDFGTIKAASEAIQACGFKNIQIKLFEGRDGGKAAQLNQGLGIAQGTICLVVDAEDDVSPELLQIANTRFESDKLDVLQGGVQLMDYGSRWFGTHAVLEYYFWFRSRMHYHAKVGMVPLGGNTVFFRTQALIQVGGWDTKCLTEDGDIGIRLSILGKKFGVFYDPIHVTKEEIPDTTLSYLKQRTRWIQGFIQILQKGDYKQLRGIKKALAIYVLIQPLFQAFVLATTPISIWTAIFVKMPAALSLLSFIPMLAVIVFILLQLLGLYDFGKEQGLRISIKSYLVMLLTYVPYQCLVGYAAFRAVKRHSSNAVGWEKTAHSGAHRLPALNNAGVAA